MYPGIGITAETNPLVAVSKLGSEEYYQLYLALQKTNHPLGQLLSLLPLYWGVEKVVDRLPKPRR